VAKFFQIDPDVVEYDWCYLDYLDRRDFVVYQGAVDYAVHEAAKE
jgi:hypothetical protein